MEFVDNTGHIFSLPSFNQKPIGYEYEENDYVFWLNDKLEYRLSINNYYVKPIYFIYQNNHPEDLDIKIYFNNSNVFKLLSPISIQEKISSLESLDDFIEFNDDSDIIKSELTNDDLYVISTKETLGNTEYDFSLFPIYVIGLSEEEGTWLSNLMIYINDDGEETWCPITIGGMFVNEYEELIINGKNMGISLPKDILKSIYSESIYNDEYNVEIYNKKLKEYLLNYMGIRGELGNYNSVINSLNWFGYGDKISISKLFKTDNIVQTQYLRNYFHIENDMLKSFNKFKLDSLISLMIMINKESGETYPIDFERYYLMGENKPKLIDLINHLEKIKIGNHNMEIEDDPEKYFYWKTYFDFSFNELGIKLSLLKYYYKKYFLPIHLNVHTASLGHLVFANDIKMSAYSNINVSYPIATSYNEEYEIEFPGNHMHYYTKQIHYIDNMFNEFSSDYINSHDNITFYELNDTCINIPIKFKNNGLFNCIFLLERQHEQELSYIHYIINQNNEEENITITLNYEYESDTFTYDYPNIELIKNDKDYKNESKYAYIYGNEKIYSDYFDSYEDMINHAISVVLKRNYVFDSDVTNLNDIIHIKILSNIDKFDEIRINNVKYNDNKIYLDNHNDVLFESHFSFYTENYDYKNFILYPKKINVKNLIESKYFEYWVNSNFLLKICVNNKWYEYSFKTFINKPVLDFGRLKYKYFLNNTNDIIKEKIDDDELRHYLLIVGNKDFDTFISNDELENINIDDDFDYETLYDSLSIDGDNSLIVPLDKSSKIYDSVIDYGMVSLFPQISRITDKISFNAYINDHNLVEVNNINYDIDFYKIIKYHLDNNINYLDGTLINNEFFKYIEYFNIIKINDKRVETYFNNPKNNIFGLECYLKENNVYHKYYIKYSEAYKEYQIFDINGNFIKTWEGLDEYMLRYQIYLHNDLLGKDIILTNTILSNLGHNLLYAYDSNIYLLREVDKNSNAFEIVNNDAHIFGTEDDNFYILLENIKFDYKADEDCYVYNDKKYYIYDKLYQNEDYIYSHYSYNPNLINNDKYLNNIHLFNLCERKYKVKNILQFNKNIDIRVNGVNFKYLTRSKSKLTESNLLNNEVYGDEFEISGPLYHNIIDVDTRYPDAYGLYWDKIFTDYNRYQYNLNDLYQMNNISIIKDLNNNTYMDYDKNEIIVKESKHCIISNLFNNDIILKYNVDDDKYYTYNNYKYNNSKYDFIIYDSNQESILCTGVGLINHEESFKKIVFNIIECNNNEYIDHTYYIKKLYVDSNDKYKLYDFETNEFVNKYISVNDTIEVQVIIDDSTVNVTINDVNYELNLIDRENPHTYLYVYDEEHNKEVYFEEMPIFEITTTNNLPVTLIIERNDKNEYYQYFSTDDKFEYRKLLNVTEGYYKYLYIQEEPYKYLNYGIYVKRTYNKDNNINKLEELPIDSEEQITQLNEYYYWEDKDEYTELGICHFNKLEDFYNGNYIEDSKTFKGELRLDNNVYKWKDPNFYSIDNKDYEYDLSYKISISLNGEEKLLSSEAVIGDEYDYIIVKFYYNKLYLVKNKYYQLNDFLESPYVNATRDRDGKYYLNDKICYVETLEYYEFDYDENHYKFIKKENNKFYDEDNNEVNINIDNDILTYIINPTPEENDEIIIRVNINEVNIYKKYFVIADDKTIEVNKVSNSKCYVDYYGNNIKLQNPSGYWYDIDNDQIQTLDRSLNELERYWFIENSDNIDMPSGNTIQEIEEQLNIYVNKLRNSLEKGLNMDNSIELRYKYKNYLEKKLTGLQGKFEIDWDVENIDDDIFNLCICITKEDDTIEIISNKHQIFELTGNEKEVIVYMRLNTKNTNIENIPTFIAKPRILSISESTNKLRYKYKESGNPITIRVNNREYKYGDNSSQNIIDLYNRFFVCKYNLYDLYINEENKLSNHLLYSIYEANENIQINSKVRYDFYLMHDNEYWYGLYISRDTCDKIENKDINIPKDSKTLYLDNDFVLQYERSSKEFLINRMKYISTNGYNHFNNNELICVRMTNNNRLPIRTDISAKWNIHGMSLDMNLNNEFESNAETTIIGLPKDDNKYQKGYYNVTVRYSLDRDLQHQFKDTGTFRVE